MIYMTYFLWMDLIVSTCVFVGWHGNEERKKRIAAMPPTVQASMKREKTNT